MSVPYDPAMRADALRLDRLAPATQQAWARAADVVTAARQVGAASDAAPSTPQPVKRPTPEPDTPLTNAPPVVASPPDPAPPPPPTAPQGSTSDPVTTSGGSVSSYLRGQEPAQTAPATGAAGAATPEPSTSSEPSEPPESGTKWWRDRRVLLAAAAAVLVGLLALAFVAGGALLGDDGPTPAPVGQAPVYPVEGWSRDGAWRSPALAEDASVLTAEDTVVTTVAGEAGPELTALRGEGGAGLWSTALENPLSGPPQVVTRGGEEAVVAATANSLIMWPDVGSGDVPQPRTWDYTEAELELVEGSAVPVLANEDTLTALVLHEGELQRRTLPSGYHPVTADEGGSLLTVSDDGHWRTVGAGDRVTEPVRSSRPRGDRSCTTWSGRPATPSSSAGPGTAEAGTSSGTTPPATWSPRGRSASRAVRRSTT